MNSTTGSGEFLNTQHIGGFGYAMGISLGMLLLITTIALASYVCSSKNNTEPIPQPRRTVMIREVPVLQQPCVVEIGIDEETLRGYPKLPYSQAKVEHEDSTALCCSICLADYKNTEMLRLLPNCGHLFHLKCVDPWLRSRPTCPVCRTSPLPTPL